MQDLLMKMQPDRLEDLIAANALYRPGPMELIPLYCNRKHGRKRCRRCTRSWTRSWPRPTASWSTRNR